MKKLIVIPLLVISLICSAATYYVKTGGNDANTGLSDAQAWAMCPGMVGWAGAVVLVPGDIVRFNRGDTWTSADPLAPFLTISVSGTAGNYISYKAYGAGARPILNISADKEFPVIQGLGKSYIKIDSLEISHFEGTQDAGTQDGIMFGKDAGLVIPHDWVITHCVIHNCPDIGIEGYDDSYNITIGDTTATGTASTTAYSNYIYDCGYAGVMLCGRDPVSNHSHFKVYYNYINDIDPTDAPVNAYGISFSSLLQGTDQGESDGWPAYCYARYNYITDITLWEGIDCHGGQYIYVQDNYIYDILEGITVFARTNDAGYESSYCDYVYIERNIIENPGDNALGDCKFIIGYGKDATTRATNYYIRENILFYTSIPYTGETAASGLNLKNFDGLTIEGNKFYNFPTTNSLGVIYFPAASFKNVIITKNIILGGYYCILFINAATIDGDMTISYNIMKSSVHTIHSSGGTIGGDMYIYNNTIFSTGGTNTVNLNLINLTLNAGKTLNIKNNIMGFTFVNISGYYIQTPGTINGTVDCDYNLYYNSTIAKPFYYLAATHSMDEWVGHGYDTHSPNGVAESYNPLLKGFNMYVRATDFDIKTTSPAINAGTDVSLTHDIFGFEIIGNPDIGAIEARSFRFYVH